MYIQQAGPEPQARTIHKYIAPHILSSSAGLQAGRERTSHAPLGDNVIPPSASLVSPHERKRLADEQGNSCAAPPKLGRTSNFPGSEDPEENAGNRIGSSLTMEPPIG